MLNWFKERKIRPTLRTLFYRLSSPPLEVIPNTENAYKRLSKVLVKERKEGRIPWDAIADKVRLVVTNFDDRYETPEEYIQHGINFLKNAHDSYTIPRWYNQKHYVEAWVEKLELTDTFESFLEGRDVRVVPNAGFASWTFLYENFKRLAAVKEKYPDKIIHILYF